MSEEKLETAVYKPAKKEKRTVSLIWILPLLVLGILVWTAYESYSQKGTNISIVFKSAEGLKVGVTPIQYKGLTLGKVTKINIIGLNSVKVNVLVEKFAAKYVASDKVDFWIKKPTARFPLRSPLLGTSANFNFTFATSRTRIKLPSEFALTIISAISFGSILLLRERIRISSSSDLI